MATDKNNASAKVEGSAGLYLSFAGMTLYAFKLKKG